MKTARKQAPMTFEEYLVRERQAAFKSEYFPDEIVALAGAGRRHNLIVANVIGELRSQLKTRPCHVYPSDMKVRIAKAGASLYPDVMVVCGEEKFEDESGDCLLNPTVVIEVLSDSTERYDRGKKFEHYRQLESLAEYLLVSCDEIRVEKFTRQSSGLWMLSETIGIEASVVLESVSCSLALSEIYLKVD
jgi:Uma2 family endonuclease